MEQPRRLSPRQQDPIESMVCGSSKKSVPGGSNTELEEGCIIVQRSERALCKRFALDAATQKTESRSLQTIEQESPHRYDQLPPEE